MLNRFMAIIAAVSIATGVSALVSQGAQAQEQKPNIVIIWGDDIGQSNISAYSKG